MPYSITEFEHIYKSNVARCMRLATGLLNDEDDARDVVQDVFVKLWESKIEVSNHEAFIIRSVRNACLDRIKTTDARERIRRSLPLEPAPEDEDPELRSGEIKQAVDRLLTDRQKQVLEHVYDHGYSYKQTAESLNVSVALVNKSLVNAMKTLRNHFKSNKR